MRFKMLRGGWRIEGSGERSRSVVRSWAPRADAFDNCRAWQFHMTALKRDYLQAGCAREFQQLPLPQKEIRVGWPAEFLVADAEGLVYQHPALGERRRQNVQQRAPEIVCDDDAVKQPA